MNQQAMMKLRKMQKEMETAQKKLEETVFSGTAGGGMVRIEMTGAKSLVGVKIDKDAIESSDDVEMLEDTLLAAFNDCLNQIDKESDRIMGPFTSMLPGGLF